MLSTTYVRAENRSRRTTILVRDYTTYNLQRRISSHRLYYIRVISFIKQQSTPRTSALRVKYANFSPSLFLRQSVELFAGRKTLFWLTRGMRSVE